MQLPLPLIETRCRDTALTAIGGYPPILSCRGAEIPNKHPELKEKNERMNRKKVFHISHRIPNADADYSCIRNQSWCSRPELNRHGLAASGF
jgi:hypothetical protein